MTRTKEARFWQAFGAVVGVAGGALFAYDFGHFGLASIQQRAMTYGLAAGFLVLAGGACYIAGRALQVEETVLSPAEGRLWGILGFVCVLAGAVGIFGAWQVRTDLYLDRIAMGLAGAFSVMFGVVCILGQRVMTHRRGAFAEKAQGRSAGA